MSDMQRVFLILQVEDVVYYLTGEYSRLVIVYTYRANVVT